MKDEELSELYRMAVEAEKFINYFESQHAILVEMSRVGEHAMDINSIAADYNAICHRFVEVIKKVNTLIEGK